MGIFWLIALLVLLTVFVFTAHVAIFATVKLTTIILIGVIFYLIYKITK